MSNDWPVPLPPIDLGDFGQALEPPVFAPLATAFAASLAPLLTSIDQAHAALFAETALDLTALLGGDDELAPAGAVDPLNTDEALQYLGLAQQGFATLRGDLASLKSMLPADAILGTTIIDRSHPTPNPGTPGGGPGKR